MALIQGEYDSLYNRLRSQGAHMEEVDRELSPILAELCTLGPEHQDHPTVKWFSNWLLDPQRTVEHCNYVIGPLLGHIMGIMTF